MTPGRWVIVVLAAACLLCACPARAGADDGTRILLGDEEALWLVRRKPAKFDVLRRPGGQAWEWVARDIGGEPVRAAVSGRQLHVFLRQGGYLIFHGSRDFTVGGGRPLADKMPDPRWPEGAAPLAVCGAGPFAGAEGPTLIAALRYTPSRQKGATQPAARTPSTEAATQPAATQPATSRPASQPGTKADRIARSRRTHLELFQRVGGSWKFLAERRDLPADTHDGRVELAVAGKALYLLEVPAPGAGEARLLRWRPEGGWKRVDLPDGVASRGILAMRTIRGWLVLVVARPAGGKADAAAGLSLHLVIREGADAEFVEQTITGPQGALTWDEDKLPLVAAMGNELALFWRGAKGWRLAPCPANGQIASVHEVDILERPAPDDSGRDMLDRFWWTIMASVLFSTFLLRPKTPAAPTEPPKSVRPGKLWRRVGAVVVDLVLTNVAASLLIAPAMGLVDPEQIQRLRDEMMTDQVVPATVGIYLIGLLSIIAAYGFLMERRFGWTLGKRLFGLHVVGADGQKPDLRGTLLRNLTKIIELMPWFWPLLLIPIFSRYRVRLGDLLARTIVVQPNLDAPPDETGAPPGPSQSPAEPPALRPPPDEGKQGE